MGGFDGTGGAGILADFRVANYLGLNPYFISTSTAVQNNSSGFGNFPISKEALKLSLKSVFEEADIEFAKIGMVGSLELAECIMEEFSKRNIKIILDTPIKATSGAFLQDRETILTLAKNSFLVTPNLGEFKELGMQNTNYTLIKSFYKGTDRLLCKGELVKDFSLQSLDLSYNIRGTGCSLASAICCFLFLGESLENSISKGKQLIYDGMKNALLNKSRFLSFYPS